MYRSGARAYERHADTSLYNAGYERPAMLTAIGDVTGLRIIDAGCAAGYYAATLSSGAKSVIALDISPDMIAIVNEKRLPNVDARVHDLTERLSWIADGTIDLVVSSLAMHYLASWEVTLREFHRVLVPGGRLVLSTHHPAMTRPLVDDYFQVQLVRDTWSVDGVPREVRYYHRPMSTIVDELLAPGFTLHRLIEPRLALHADAGVDERKLATQPWFLILDARKRA